MFAARAPCLSSRQRLHACSSQWLWQQLLSELASESHGKKRCRSVFIHTRRCTHKPNKPHIPSTALFVQYRRSQQCVLLSNWTVGGVSERRTRIHFPCTYTLHVFACLFMALNAAARRQASKKNRRGVLSRDVFWPKNGASGSFCTGVRCKKNRFYHTKTTRTQSLEFAVVVRQMRR